MSQMCLLPKTVKTLKERLINGEITTDEIAKMLPKEKAELKALLEDFVTDKLGVSVSANEVKTINKLSKSIDKAQKSLGENLGNPSMPKENLDFFVSKKKMDDYLNSVSPTNKLKIATGTIGRGMMLFSAKSPILNIGSNIEIGLTESIARRITNLSLKRTDNKLAKQFQKMNREIFNKTGYDMSRMLELGGNDIILGENVISSQGKGATRAVGRAVEDIVFKNLMGKPDVYFASKHFADSVNLNSLKMAKGDKEVAKDMMIDSMRLNPTTADGKILRDQAILDAQTATWTNTTWASKVSSGIRKVLNDVSGDLRAGDYLLPFIKTPANVIATGMDYAGMGIPKAAFKLVKAIRSGDLGDRTAIQSIVKDLTRAGLGITGGAIIAANLSDDDFMGAYDPNRAQIETLKNSNYNAIKIGDKWISTAWLGPLAIPVTAQMYARKYGKSGGEKAFKYGEGVISSVGDLPGISDIRDQVKSQTYKKNQSLDEMTSDAGDYAMNEIYSRLVPSFISDVSKSIDETARVTKGKTAGIPNAIISKTPFSKTLPEKRNIFGEVIKNEPAASIMLFGSRVKTDKSTALIKEIDKVSKSADKNVNFTDWDKSTGKILSQFKQTVGNEKYNKAKIEYGKELKKQLEELVKQSEYKGMNDIDKLNEINKQDAIAIKTIYSKYGFKYKK